MEFFTWKKAIKFFWYRKNVKHVISFEKILKFLQPVVDINEASA